MNASEQIYFSLKERLAVGEFKPGMRLTEEQIAAELGSSRTPVREAMRRLVADGLLEFRRNYGTFVSTLTTKDIGQLFDIRMTLESEVAAAAATSFSAIGIAELTVIQNEIEAFGADISVANLERINPLNRRFHKIISDEANNTRLANMLNNAIELPIVRQTLRRYTKEQLQRSFNHHRELIDAFSMHDVAWAKNVMCCHVRSAKFALLVKGRLAIEPN
jgi:DNA-binding GntR family transcriptional regulator